MNSNERLGKVIEDIKESFEDIGLYIVDASVATSDSEATDENMDTDFREKLASGEAMWVVQAAFTIGKVAWSDRVLNPEKHKEDTTFREMMPTEADLLREKYMEIVRRGGDISELYDEDFDFDDEL